MVINEMQDAITTRQVKRMVCLEGLVLPSLFGPVMAANGSNTMIQFALSVLLGSLFGLYLIWISGKQDYFTGKKVTLDRRLIQGVYAVRFFIRATLLLFVFVEMVRLFLLGNVDKWFLLLPVLLVTLLACLRTFSGRAKMVELLFWWMLVPLLGIWLLSIGNWKGELFFANSLENGKTEVYQVYLMLSLYLPLEGILYFVPHTTEQGEAKISATKGLFLGVIVSSLVFLMAYLTVGNEGLRGRLFGVAYMLQFVKLPANLLSRLDVLVMPFLLLGLFLILSGMVFYCVKSLQFAFHNTRRNWLPAVVVLTFMVVWLFFGVPSTEVVLSYFAWIDIPLAIILPLICVMGTETMLRLKKLTVIFLCCVLGLTGCRQVDMEDKDYVLMLGVDYEDDDDLLKNEEFEYHVTMADMQGYTAQMGETLKAKTKSGKNKSLKAFRDSYSRNHATTMDFGHVMLLLLEEDIFENPKALENFLNMLQEEELISSTVLVAATEDETEDIAKLDEKEDAVISEALVEVLKKDGNVEITLMDLYLAVAENTALTVPVLDVEEDEKMPKVKRHLQVNVSQGIASFE